MESTTGNGFARLARFGSGHVSSAQSSAVLNTGKTQTLALFLTGAASAFAPQLAPQLAPLTNVWWWPATVASLLAVSLLGARWIRRASHRSPMQFVAAVNGTTAMKLFTTLGWLTAFLVNNEELRYEYVFGTFAVFVLFTAILVWGATRQTGSNEKN